MSPTTGVPDWDHAPPPGRKKDREGAVRGCLLMRDFVTGEMVWVIGANCMAPGRCALLARTLTMEEV